MKKLIMTAAAVFAFGFTNAQEVKFGAKAGLNVSMLTNDKVGTTKSGVGFLVGGIADIKLTEKISIQPELFFSQENATYNSTLSLLLLNANNTQDITLSKINLPILFKYYVIKNLALEVGPEISYIFSAKSKNKVDFGVATITGDANLENDSYPVNITSEEGSYNDIATQNFNLKKLNVALDFGTSYNFDMGLFVDARYNLGLTKFTDNINFFNAKSSEGETMINGFEGISLKNSNIQISLGYKF